MNRIFEFSLASGLEGLEQRISLSDLSLASTVEVDVEEDDDPPAVPDPETDLPEYPTPDEEPDPGEFPGYPPPPVFPPPPIGGPIGPG